MNQVVHTPGKPVPIKVLVIAPALIPSVTLGVLRPMLSLSRARIVRWRLRFERRWTVDDIRRADVVIFCRNQSSDAYAALLVAKQEGKKVIFEVDDNFFEIPVGSPIGRHHRLPYLLHTTRRMFEMADVTRVYTGAMADLAESFNANVHKTRVYFDASIIRKVKPTQDPSKVRIAFATGRSPDPALERALEEALVDVIDTYPDQVEVHFWRKPSKLLRHRRQVKIHRSVPDYDRFIRQFHGAGYDIGLAPLLTTIFYQSKTNTKFREYGACCVAGVYSRAASYVESVVDGETGLLVDNTRAGWREAISRLVEDVELRRRIAVAAAAEVAENYSYERYLGNWLATLRRAMSSERPASDIKPLFYHRNIVVPERVLTQLRPHLGGFQVSEIRGAEWAKATHFTTNLLPSLDAGNVVEGVGAITWIMVSRPQDLTSSVLRTMFEGGIHPICDVRSVTDERLRELRNRLAGQPDIEMIVVATPAQAAGIISAEDRSLLNDVAHPIYPRPAHIKTNFGYLVVAQREDAVLGNLTLAGLGGLWLQILDTISAIHPLGLPLAEKLPLWFRLIPGTVKFRFQRFLRPRDAINATRLRLANRWYQLKWERAQFLFRSDHHQKLLDDWGREANSPDLGGGAGGRVEDKADIQADSRRTP